MKSKKNITYLWMAVALAMFAMTACTHNNGDIGPLFGNWKLVSITAENYGNNPDLEGNTYFWEFQTSTIRMVRSYTSASGVLLSEETFGNYTLMDNTLNIDLPDGDYPVFGQLLLPRQAWLQVLKLTGKDMVLAWHPDDEATVTYTFKKW